GDAHHHYGLGVDDAMKLAAEKGEKDAQIIQSLQETIQALTRQNASQYDIQQALDMLAQGNTEKAEEIFEGAAAEAKRMGKEANVKEAEALRHLGSLAFLHDTQKAFNAYQRSTELDPDSQEGWNQLGHLYRRIGELENAENAYMALLKLARTDRVGQAVAYGNLGVVYYTRGDLDQAVGYWEKSLALFTEIGAKPQMAQVQSLLDNAQSEHSE
ncbi:MAG TPA: tetratricopeptide repeat protein, partial [Nitrosomonas sp.]|nr:tetratricopeptide repeat protein [Nitrosomonas sp.]